MIISAAIARRITPVMLLVALVPLARAAASDTPVTEPRCTVQTVLTASPAATAAPPGGIAPRAIAPARTPHPAPAASIDPRLDAMAADAVRLLEACWNARDWDAVAALVTPRFLQTSLGIVGDDWRARAALGALDLGALRIESFGPVTLWSDGRGSVEVRYRRGDGAPEQAVAARWFLVAERGVARFDEEALLPPPPLGDRVTLGFGIAADDAPPRWDDPAGGAVPAAPVIALHGANRGRHPRTLHLQAANGKILGVLTLPAYTEADLVLLALPPGAYTLVDAVDNSAALRLVVGDG